MNLIDMHCDTLWKLVRDKSLELGKNPCHVDISKMQEAEVAAQFFACFVYMNEFTGAERYDEGYRLALEMMERGKEEFLKNRQDIVLTCSYREFVKNHQEGKISAFLTVEEGGIIDGRLDRIEELYNRGIRLITLLWNDENCMGYPNSKNPDIMKCGLKPFGIESLERMNKLGMIVDVSHMSDGGFWDVLERSKSPVVASHSNARTLCNHPRNLSDEMMKALAEKGGIAGLNCYPYFVNQKGKADMSDLAEHVAHMMKMGGEEFVAIGTDFDGFDEGELSICHIGQIRQLYDELRRRGFTERQLDKICSGNAMRIMKDVL